MGDVTGTGRARVMPVIPPGGEVQAAANGLSQAGRWTYDHDNAGKPTTIDPHDIAQWMLAALEDAGFSIVPDDLLAEVSKVYDHVTRGRLSKPHYMAADVIAAHDEHCRPRT